MANKRMRARGRHRGIEARHDGHMQLTLRAEDTAEQEACHETAEVHKLVDPRSDADQQVRQRGDEQPPNACVAQVTDGAVVEQHVGPVGAEQPKHRGRRPDRDDFRQEDGRGHGAEQTGDHIQRGGPPEAKGTLEGPR